MSAASNTKGWSPRPADWDLILLAIRNRVDARIFASLAINRWSDHAIDLRVSDLAEMVQLKPRALRYRLARLRGVGWIERDNPNGGYRYTAEFRICVEQMRRDLLGGAQ